MERLTDKYGTTHCDNINRVLKNGTTNKFVVGGKAISKLGEFEDFMEENKLDTLQELSARLTDGEFFAKDYGNLININTDLELELQAYKKAWSELRKYIKEMREGDLSFHDNEHDLFILVENVVLNKMQELEPKTEGNDEDN